MDWGSVWHIVPVCCGEERADFPCPHLRSWAVDYDRKNETVNTSSWNELRPIAWGAQPSRRFEEWELSPPHRKEPVDLFGHLVRTPSRPAPLVRCFGPGLGADLRPIGETVSPGWFRNDSVYPNKSWSRWFWRGRSGDLCLDCCPCNLGPDKRQKMDDGMDGHQGKTAGSIIDSSQQHPDTRQHLNSCLS